MKRSKWLGIGLLTLSVVFFVLGLLNPIMGSRLFFRIKRPDIYLWSSIQDFWAEGEWFIGLLLLLFTLLLPILKFGFLGWQLLRPSANSGFWHALLEVVNKWAMLDVFVVAVIIVNLKFDSMIIITELKSGTTFFIASILLLQLLSFWLNRYYLKAQVPA